METKNMMVAIEKDTDGSHIAYNTDSSPYTLIGRGGSVSEAKADFENSMSEVAQSEKERTGSVPHLLTHAPKYSLRITNTVAKQRP